MTLTVALTCAAVLSICYSTLPRGKSNKWNADGKIKLYLSM